MMSMPHKRSWAVRKEDFSMTGQPLTLQGHAHASDTWSIIIFVLESQAVLYNCH